ncbi:MAG: YraN family protein [Dehalococcoidia bacterium]|nr:YraN family protein [Dehalococcoidia bacterium]
MTAKRDLGDFGERVAAHRLEAAGMRVIARNVRVASGEIDIVAEDGTDLVFVEVRTRRAEAGVAAESLSPVKLRRMWYCAMQYCEREGLDPERARIDAVTVDLGAGQRATRVEHYRALDVPEERRPAW